MRIDGAKFAKTMLPACLVVIGVVLKQVGLRLDRILYINRLKHLGIILFTAGWLGIAYMTCKSHGGGLGVINTTLQCTPSLMSMLIYTTMLLLMKIKDGSLDVRSLSFLFPSRFGNDQVIRILGAVFVLAWLGLGATVSISSSGRLLGMSAALLVTTSMTSVLPWQRLVGMVYGPGMAMFGAAWVLLSMANASE